MSKRFPQVIALAVGIAVAVSVWMAKHGPISDQGPMLLALKPGQILEPGTLPNGPFKDRRWQIETWEVFRAQKPLHAGGKPCDAFGGILRQEDKGHDPNALFTAFGVICGGALMYMPSQQADSRVWLTPLPASRLTSGETWTATPTFELRFVEVVAADESVIWTTNKIVTTTPAGVRGAIAFEQAFHVEADPDRLVVTVNQLGLERDSIHYAENKAALDAYHCAWTGETFPKVFGCSTAPP